jgi:hypothetical protein
MISMKKVDLIQKAEVYIKCSDVNKPFKLTDILGDDCPTLPGKWLREEVEKRTFDTPTYIIECIDIEPDTYIKRSI